MKANYKSQFDKIRASKAYDIVKQEHEMRYCKRIQFLFLLASAMVIEEQLGFGLKRRDRFINGVSDKMNELSAYISSNTVVMAGDNKETADIDYNQGFVKKLAKQYGVEYEEEIFVDVA